MLEELMNKIEKIEKDNKTILELLLKEKADLTSYKNVAKFLNRTPKTIQNYIKRGYLIENEHFYRNPMGKVVFIPKSIIAFKNGKTEKRQLDPMIKSKSKLNELHPSVKRLLEGVI